MHIPACHRYIGIICPIWKLAEKMIGCCVMTTSINDDVYLLNYINIRSPLREHCKKLCICSQDIGRYIDMVLLLNIGNICLKIKVWVRLYLLLASNQLMLQLWLRSTNSDRGGLDHDSSFSKYLCSGPALQHLFTLKWRKKSAHLLS